MRERWQRHPTACTCSECEDRRLGRTSGITPLRGIAPGDAVTEAERVLSEARRRPQYRPSRSERVERVHQPNRPTRNVVPFAPKRRRRWVANIRGFVGTLIKTAVVGSIGAIVTVGFILPLLPDDTKAAISTIQSDFAEYVKSLPDEP
jgi:hypothetical protein